jgi:hypothetical protein
MHLTKRPNEVWGGGKSPRAGMSPHHFGGRVAARVVRELPVCAVDEPRTQRLDGGSGPTHNKYTYVDKLWASQRSGASRGQRSGRSAWSRENVGQWRPLHSYVQNRRQRRTPCRACVCAPYKLDMNYTYDMVCSSRARGLGLQLSPQRQGQPQPWTATSW